MATNEIDDTGTSSGAGALSQAANAKRRVLVFFIRGTELGEDFPRGLLIQRKRDAVVLDPATGAAVKGADGKPVTREVIEEGVKLGLVALDPLEEIESVKRARGDTVSLQYEFPKMALRKINNRAIDRGSMEHESLWTWIGPKGRNIVAAAFREVSAASEEAAIVARESFSFEEV